MYEKLTSLPSDFPLKLQRQLLADKNNLDLFNGLEADKRRNLISSAHTLSEGEISAALRTGDIMRDENPLGHCPKLG